MLRHSHHLLGYMSKGIFTLSAIKQRIDDESMMLLNQNNISLYIHTELVIIGAWEQIYSHIYFIFLYTEYYIHFTLNNYTTAYRALCVCFLPGARVL